MKNNNYTRRKFISAVAATTAVTAVSSAFPSFGNDRGKLALSGGTKVNPSGKIGATWPHINQQMIDNIVKTTKSGIWSRVQNANGNVSTFEKDFAREIGTAYSIGTGSGTQSLSTCVEALGIGP